MKNLNYHMKWRLVSRNHTLYVTLICSCVLPWRFVDVSLMFSVCLSVFRLAVWIPVLWTFHYFSLFVFLSQKLSVSSIPAREHLEVFGGRVYVDNIEVFPSEDTMASAGSGKFLQIGLCVFNHIISCRILMIISELALHLTLHSRREVTLI